ncbi:YopX family protein [Bacillus subtilis]|uniref:YopX family protein n=1 Tax=Bacillus subtilis TaxID=1423 RepID=UPI00143165F7|nr:YopX family protein [Bacillus subtilis]MED1779498.1 YopX family protein [Bacillus subtilis]NJF06924.1 hypothetical protein [Bacillus subtilis]
MREIKFRGKPIEDYGDVKWFYGNAVLNYDDKLAYIEADRQGYVPVEWESIGQYTGAKKFYEGDVVDCNGLAGLVVWNEKTHTWGVRLKIGDHIRTDRLCDWDEEATVIGTKYENPELLEASHASK